MIVWLLACSGSPEPAGVEAPVVEAPVSGPVETAGEAMPPIPADHPAWATLREGFVPQPHYYGEPTWDEVAMRVLGHLAAAERDRARLAWARGDVSGCEAAYARLAERFEDAGLQGGVAGDIAALLEAAARRDVAACADGWTRTAEAAAVDLAAFEDFDDRHRLRVELYRSYLAWSDPLQPEGVWGYWPEAIDAEAAFTVDGLGGLPTGDSYVDTAGEPGPKGIGRLSRLDVQDPEHRAWLSARVAELNVLLPDPTRLPARIEQLVTELDAHGHGSRYYNIKAARNEAVRVLARQGAYPQAVEVLLRAFPLHHQDWVCPNREGILRGIEGRLWLAAGELEQADTALSEAVRIGEVWLEQVLAAKESGPSAPPHPPTP